MTSPNNSQSLAIDLNTQLRDMEEKQRLLKDRVLLIGQTLIEEREKNFKEVQALKKDLINVKAENTRMKEFVQRITEQLSSTARKEDFMILQRQLDLIREKKE